MLAFIDFSGVAEEAGIEGIGEDVRYLVLPEQAAGRGDDAVLPEESGYVRKGGTVLGIQLKGRFNNPRFPPVDDDGLRPRVVQVSHRSGSWVLAALGLLMEAALGVGGEVEDVLVRHAELDGHGDDILAGDVALFRGADVPYRPDLEKPADRSLVHRIAGQPVEFPAKDAGSLALLDAANHLVENRATRSFGGLLLDELGNDAQPLVPGEGAHDSKLVINRADLLVFDVGRFSGIEEVLRHSWIISQRIV